MNAATLAERPVTALSGVGPALAEALARLGLTAFRPGQREAVETLFAKRRLLLVAPTGGGKSLTYQLPATLLPGTTLVVSPLIALMQDQAQALEQRGVAATFLSSTLESGEMRRRMARAARGAAGAAHRLYQRLRALRRTRAGGARPGQPL